MPTAGFYDTVSCGVDYGARVDEAALGTDILGSSGPSVGQLVELATCLDATTAHASFGSLIQE